MRVEISTQRSRGAESGVATQARLGDVCRIDTSISFPCEEEIWLLNLDMIEQQTGRVIQRVYVDRNVLGGSTVAFDENCVLYSKLRPNLNKVVLPDRKGVATSEILPLRCNADHATREFVCWFLRSPTFVSYAMNRTAGAKMPRLGTKELLNAKIPLPPLADQRRIATKLDRLCDIVTKRKQQLVQLQQLVKSRFVEMFGDLNGSLFPRATIGEVCEVKSGGTPDRKVREYWENGDIPWVKTTELKNCELYDSEEHITTLAMNESSAKLVPPETILLAMYGQGRTRGMTAKLKIAATTNQACACILPGDKVDQDYLWHYLVLSYEKIRALAQGAGQPNLNGKMIRSFGVPLPPLPLQREFAAFVAKVDKLAFAVKNSLESAEKLYRQQLSEAFA